MTEKEKFPAIRIVSLHVPAAVEKPFDPYIPCYTHLPKKLPWERPNPIPCLAKEESFPCLAKEIILRPLRPCILQSDEYCSCDGVCKCDCDHCSCDCDHCRCDCDFCTCDSKSGKSPEEPRLPESCETHYRTFFRLARPEEHA